MASKGGIAPTKNGQKSITRKYTILSFTRKYTTLTQCLFLILILIWVGFLGVRFEVGKEGGLKLVRITLETSNLARKYTFICSFRKYTF